MMVRATGANTRALTEGALLAAVTVLLALAGVLFQYIYMLVPVPLVILVYRHGMNWGIVVGLASALLTGILTALPNTVGVINLGAIGLAIGGMMRERKPPVATFAVGTFVSMVVVGISLFITAYVFGVNDITELTRALDEAGRQAAQFYARLGVDPKAVSQLTDALTQTVRTLLPSMFVVSAGFITLVSFWFARLLLRRLGENVPGLPAFKTWSFPLALAVAFVAAMAAGLYLPSQAYPEARLVLANIVWLMGLLFLLQGLAVAWAWLERGRVAVALRVLLVYFAFVYFYYGIVFLGVVDVWAHFRRKLAP